MQHVRLIKDMDELRKALKRMKSGKALGPDYIPVELWRCLGEVAIDFLTGLFNRILYTDKIPDEWRITIADGEIQR